MNLIPFIMTCFILEATPGPNMGYLILLSLDKGVRAALSAVAGVAIGLLAIGILVEIGVGIFIIEYPHAYDALRWFGTLYLLWLAYDVWKEISPSNLNINDDIFKYRRYFLRGFITNILNPKAIIFFIAVLPGFLPDGSSRQDIHILTGIYVMIATFVHVGLVIGASYFKPLLADITTEKKIKIIFSILLVCISVWFAFSTAR